MCPLPLGHTNHASRSQEICSLGSSRAAGVKEESRDVLVPLIADSGHPYHDPTVSQEPTRARLISQIQRELNVESSWNRPKFPVRDGAESQLSGFRLEGGRERWSTVSFRSLRRTNSLPAAVPSAGSRMLWCCLCTAISASAPACTTNTLTESRMGTRIGALSLLEKESRRGGDRGREREELRAR